MRHTLNETEWTPSIGYRVHWKWQESVVALGTTFAKYVHKNIWNLTPTPCINLRHLHGLRTLLNDTAWQHTTLAAVRVCHLHTAQCFFWSKCLLVYGRKRSLFWHAFAKLRQATISFVMSVHLSVRPNEIIRLPLDGFSWNLLYKYFFRKSVNEINFLLKCDKRGTFHQELCTFTTISC
jgi:hypothetical protein